jgi:6-phosphogluconolactonase
MENIFETRNEASNAAADRIAEVLSKRLERQRDASLVVSGGTTPERCFQALAGKDLDWARVHVLLSDERWVPPNDNSSNEKLVRETLLQAKAGKARLAPLYAEGVEIAEHCEVLETSLRRLPLPFSVCLLGMGEDGHFASLFPDAANLEAGLDKNASNLCMPVSTAASPHPRVSLTLAALSRSDEIILLIFGDRKREVYERAKTTGNTYPVAHLLKQKQAPVHMYWAP